MKPLPTIIGFTGQATAGKTSAAMILASLINHRTCRASFADPIRGMLMALGLDAAELSEHKNQPHRLLCGRTPRQAMQTLGTEWGRKLIGEDIWCRAALNAACEAIEQYADRVIFDDVRFDNEAEGIRKLGGIVIEVSRPGLPPRMNHESERGVAPALIDHYVHATDLEDLKTKIITLLNEHYTT
jgi:hypothetical protein